MFYSLVPLLISSLAIFRTPHAVRKKKGYSAMLKIVSLFSSFLALLIILMFPTTSGYAYFFKEDALSFIFALLAGLMGFLTILFSTWYVHENEREFYSTMLLFIASMIGLVVSNNIILMVVFWELTTMASFGLIRMKGTDDAISAANKAWMINQVGGIAVLIAASYSYWLGIHTIDALLVTGNVTILSLLVLAALTKSAVFPFHPWLPSAMEAYAPVSALLHSASMVMAGVYLLIRLTPLMIAFAELRMLLILLGLLTILVSSLKAFVEEDIKRVLAYSTLTNIGMIVVCIAFASPFSIAAALFHVVSHAFFKASLFLEAGVFEHSLKTRDINRLVGAIDKLPITTFFFTLSSISAMGIPVTMGFLSKFAMYESTLPLISLFLLFGTVLALGYYTPILGFFLARAGGKRMHESLKSILAIAPLSLGSVLLAVYPYPITDACAKAARELFSSEFAFPTLMDPQMLYLSLLLFAGALLIFNRRKLVVPFRSGEIIRGAAQTPSAQIGDIRKGAAIAYSFVDVDRVYVALYPIGSFISKKLDYVHSLLEVK